MLTWCVHFFNDVNLAFAPILANSFGQFGCNFGTDTPQFLWNLADHQANKTFGFTIDSPADTTSQFLGTLSPIPVYSTGKRLQTSSQPQIPRKSSQTLDIYFLRRHNSKIGQTFKLACSPEYYRWLENNCHNW
jgi:hypothetical protein